MAEEPIREEMNPDNLRHIINNIGENVSKDVERRHRLCRLVNGNTLVQLIQKHNIPGLIYTISPLSGKKFSDPGWNFHAVGILKLGDSKYAAFDQTNSQTRNTNDPSYFFVTGDLDEVSSALGERFGENWDLGFNTGNNDRDKVISVSRKLDAVEELIREGKSSSLTYKDVTPTGTPDDPFIDDKKINRPLGIKFLPIAAGPPYAPALRERFTFGYA